VKFKLKAFFEQMFFSPRYYHIPFILLFLPLSLIYGIIMSLRRILIKKKDFDIPIISVGNLIVGGSGKTPFVIALSLKYENVTIISRGYGRQSRGLVEVSEKGEILTSVEDSGDEAMLMAISLPKASVLVSEDREKAIKEAKRKGAKLIIMDDGFNRINIKKFEILLEPKEIKNYLPFPAGAFREFYFNRYYADIIAIEEDSFKREVWIENAKDKMILVTAISNPKRLDKYLALNNIVYKYYLPDHSYFDEEILEALLLKYQAKSILCTSKDYVKMQGFKLEISQIKLKFIIKDEILYQIDKYIKGYK